MCRLMIYGKGRCAQRPYRRDAGCCKSPLWDLGVVVLLLAFFASCNYTKYLTEDEYALVKNNVKVEEVKGQQFDDLISFVRPIPNKKFMDIFPIKVSLWTYHQPKIDLITGKTKDTKFNRWLRNRGEPITLLDSAYLQRSISQIELAMFQRGYFDAQARAEVNYLKKQKAKVNYFVTPHRSYYIRSVDYQIDIPEYKRIVLQDTANSLIRKGRIYNEERFAAERARIVSNIRDHGYYYVNNNLVTFLVDTVDAFEYPNAQGNPTLSLTIKISYDEVNDPTLIAKSKNRYKFNDVLIHTNYDLNIEHRVRLDTVLYLDFKNKSDSTLYKFVTVKKRTKGTHKTKLIKDYNSRTIAGAVWMKKGDMFSQTAYDRTSKKLRALNNFSIINITYDEDEALWDSIQKMGVLNTTLRLTRAKQHSIGGNFELRTDRTNLELNYTNKNIFRGAEYLRIKGYGSVYYYEWFNSQIKNTPILNGNGIYGEVGGSASLLFPRLLMLPKYQNINFWSYSTEILISASYTWFYKRLNAQVAYKYSWKPTIYLTHSISPLDWSTINSRIDQYKTPYENYPDDYKRKFNQFFIPSSRYTLRYEMPQKSPRHKLDINFSFETAGLLLYAANRAVNSNSMWRILDTMHYGRFEKFDFSLVHTRRINRNNSFATRFVFGMAIPYTKDAVIPFDRSFFVGGSNSMRGWSFRQLGPGGYLKDKSNRDNYMERVGDMRLELDLEYRGTIYKAIKYALFSDMGNVWLLSKYDGMPDAEFNFNTFYKQIAVCVGAGIRLDFNYFIIRLDYGLPLYDPSNPAGNKWTNNNWFKDRKTNPFWKWTHGIQFGIGYAFQ